MSLITPELGLIFWQLFFFSVLFFVLKKLAWGPILSALAEREKSISDALEMAAKTRQEMAEMKESNAKAAAVAAAERDAILKEAKTAADKMIADAKAAAASAAAVETEKARVAFENEKNTAIAQLRKETVALVIETSEKILRKELSDKTTSEKLVSDLITQASLN
jgi:F-type H+-transporting ATPase subunit b